MDQRANILLVDDKPQDLLVLESILEAPEYRLVRAHNANQALQALLTSPPRAGRRDAGDGRLGAGAVDQGLQEDRTHPNPLPHRPFSRGPRCLKGYGAGAVDYLTKPVNSQILKSKVAVFAELFRTSQALAAALREKETLLKEVHHRVKNNLQIISSFLDLQAGRSQDAGARAALAESQGRMRVMALVHQLLYERNDFSRVDLGEYLER